MSNVHQNMKELSEKVDQLKKLAQELHDSSDDFPAVNRNVKRIIASVEMIRLNVEQFTLP